LITGIKLHFSSTKVLVAGQSCSMAALVAPLTQRVTSGNAVIAQRAALQAATNTDNETVASSSAFVSATVEAVYVAFGNDAAALADFGLLPRKKPSMTPAQKLAASEKAKATRAARHTLGSKQKLLVTGETVAAGSASAPAAASNTGALAGTLPAGSVVTPLTPHS
jgi:hypothetical protein